ncbi:MAG TPA: baseplate J/gp47 family protein [Acidimicrobiales bacterium]|nr:baseplate J/gp47 family protein [Acidimicrobiales bacterium]
MSTDAVCPCDAFVHPAFPWNPPGSPALRYRVGDWARFRRAMLSALPGERQLVRWRPTGHGDLALQVVEWWAYLADVLTFYNERIANESYLGTATLPESVRRLVAVLGYRPRPGIAATGTVAALLRGAGPVTLPRGLQLQSKPGPGKKPQTFEVDAAVTVEAPDETPSDPPPTGLLLASPTAKAVLLRGRVTGIEPGERLLLLPRSGALSGAALVTVASLAPQRSPRGRTGTLVTFTATPSVPAGAKAADYRLLRSTQSVRPWQYSANPGVALTATTVDLDSVARFVLPGDPLLLDTAGAGGALSSSVLVRAAACTEVVWYANAAASSPGTPPSGTGVIPVPVPHTRVAFMPSVSALAGTAPGQVTVRAGWADVGTPIAAPPTALPIAASGGQVASADGRPFAVPAGGAPVLVEDVAGSGVRALAVTGPAPALLTLIDVEPADTGPLQAPLRVLRNLVPVSRGTTVGSEVLGSGDASVAGQEFVLAKSPLTYLPEPDPSMGVGWTSTLRVWVDGVAWTEVPTFFGQPPAARVFVTREDEQQRTHVVFGDGVNGARIPTGTGNVVAAYRVGSGAEAPAAGALTVVMTPQPKLKGFRNPVAVGGGGDPDPPERIARNAPRSVLTFGRAVSSDDYAVVAAEAPGVARARSYWSWDAEAQRGLVVLYVGDDGAAVSSARTAVAAAADPNRPVSVRQALPVPVRLSLAVRVDRDRQPAAVTAGVHAALADPDTGLLGTRGVRIGRSLYTSEVHETCFDVPGVLAVHDLHIEADHGAGMVLHTGARVDPGEGRFLRLAPADLLVTAEEGS